MNIYIYIYICTSGRARRPRKEGDAPNRAHALHSLVATSFSVWAALFGTFIGCRCGCVGASR